MSNGAKFAVNLDGTHVATCSSTITDNVTPTSALLWSTSGLSSSNEHILKVVHNDTAGRYLSVEDIRSVSFCLASTETHLNAT
jgi:hypothetical protein